VRTLDAAHAQTAASGRLEAAGLGPMRTPDCRSGRNADFTSMYWA